MRLGLSIPTMDEPANLVDLGIAADANGWDGVFLWDHTIGTPDMEMPVSDTWVVLGALAAMTHRITLGTTITALPRRQPHEVARQTVTLDRLSNGRSVLGVGLGEPPAEYTALGRTADRPVLAEMLDEALEVLSGLWSGQPYRHDGTHYHLDDVQFLPTPRQSPRVPVWVSAMTRNERTLGRASRWDGVILGATNAEGGMDELPPDAVAEVAARSDAPADIVVAAPVGTDASRYADAGATWVLHSGSIDELTDVAAAPPSASRTPGG